jgi:hypothetical protein
MLIRRTHVTATVILVLGLLMFGCTNIQSPTTPSSDLSARNTESSTHKCLGLWQFTIDPVHGTLDYVPIRAIQTHMNALSFMEPPAGVLLKVDQIVSTAQGEITVDIALKHPYSGMDFATAFDVCGILISHGSEFFPLSTKLFFAGDDQVRLLNPDGWTRWWNPVEFPANASNPSKGYIDGLLGKKDSKAHFDSTLNGYKYFASDLTSPDSDLSGIDTSMRGAFVPGTTCIRRYRIAYTPGNLVFNYAVDASWAPPTGPKPIDIPGDFPENANRAEAYRIEVHNVNNTLHYDSDSGTGSGILAMSVYVFDWFNAGSNLVCAYPQTDELMGFCTPKPSGGTDAYSVYNVELWPQAMTKAGDVLVWLEMSSEKDGYQGMIPFDKEIVAFQHHFTISGG